MRLRALVAVVATGFLMGIVPPVFAEVPLGPQGPQSVAGLAKRLSPAVVNISSSHHGASGHAVPRPQAPNGSGNGVDQGFDDGSSGGDQGAAAEDSESLGSGFIVSADGLVVTNNHVIEGSDQIQVFLADGSHWPATIVGTDTQTDIAVLRIDARHKLPFVEFDDSDTAEVGDWVMAIGNPFGLGGTVTLGIVSARNRDIQSGPYDSYIQTDASINQGNSGGPLFDMNGKVVGINTAIVAEGGASLGIGFAIPGNLAKPVVDQLVQYGETRRGWLGVGIQDVTDDIAASLGRTDTHGAMVTDVTKTGPADGVLDEGDIILDFDGKEVDTMHDLPRLVAETAVGKLVPVKVLRDGSELVLAVTLGRLKDSDGKVVKSSQNSVTPKAPLHSAATLAELLGFELAPIDAAKRKAYALPDSAEGLVITSVKAGSDADTSGLTPGLVIAAVNGQGVAKTADVQAIVDAARKAGRTAVLLRVVDPAGAGRFIGVKLTD